MDSAAARWKRPWEDSRASSLHQQLHQNHVTPLPANSAPPAPHDDPSAPQTTFRARRESSVQPLYLPESPSMLQSYKRRRLLPDQIPQSHPHLSGHSAESAGYLGSGEDYDDSPRTLTNERGRQQLQPASPAMVSARFDAHGFLPMVTSQDEKPCCDPACSGLTCARRRALIHEIVAEIESLNWVLRSDSQPRSHSSGAARLGTDQALVFAVDLLRSNVNNLRDLARQPSNPLGEGTTAAATAELRDIMKRRFDPAANSEIPSFLPQPQRGDRDPSRAILPSGHPEDIRRNFQSSRDPLSPRHSPTGAHSAHSGGNTFTRPTSPTHNHHPHRMLPSPTSLNIVAPPSTIHSLSSPTPSSLFPHQLQQQPPPSSAAHTAHLQDLQHQISLKTLALQALRQEYDALLSKLDRQRTRCAALERKFEVSDMEINSLTTDKEELEQRVAALEQQVDELRDQRDDAQRREVRTAAQYRSIVEMAGRLQGIAAGEKRAWVVEREGLLRALGWDGDGGKGDESAGGTGGVPPPQTQAPMMTTASTTVADSRLTGTSRGPVDADVPDQAAASAAASGQVIAALRVEVARLRSRTQSLESAIRSIRDQGASMEEAARAAAEAGKRMREAAREAVGDP